MGRGILSGLFWGSVISALVLGTVSQLSPLPRATMDPVSETGPGDAESGTADAGGEAGAEQGDTGDTVATAPVVPEVPQEVARLDEPASDATPAPADPAPQQTPATGPQSGASEGVAVPAGSEFRKAPPETAANVPTNASAPEGVHRPAVPEPQAGDAAAVAGNVVARPATPGMSVQSPAAPQVDGAAPSLDDISAAEPGRAVTPAVGPETPEVPDAEVAPGEGTLRGFPPPRRPDPVVASANPGVGDATEVAAPLEGEATPAPASQTADAATRADTGSIAPLTDTTRMQPTEIATGDTVSQSESADTVAGTAPQLAETADTQAQDLTGTPPTDGNVTTPSADVAPSAGSAADGMADAITGRPVDERPASVADADAPGATAADGVATAPPVVSATAPSSPAIGSPSPTSDRQSASVTEANERAVGTDVTPSDPVAETGTGTETAALAQPRGIGQRVLPLTERNDTGSRLPQIRQPSPVVVEPDATEDATADAPEAAGAPRPKLDALSLNAVPFANPDGKPLLSVILIDDGTGGLDRSVLRTFSFPVTFAIDPTRPDSAEAAAAYRAAGFEVVLLANGLPDGATAQDLEVLLEAGLTQVPQAVAVMDPQTGGLAGDRALISQALDILATDGFGLIGWQQGLGSLKALADKSGHPATMVFRALDSDDEKTTVIRRYLDRAAFKAAQDGSVVMVGRARPETVTALFEWVLGSKSSQIALAPVSAVLRQR